MPILKIVKKSGNEIVFNTDGYEIIPRETPTFLDFEKVLDAVKNYLFDLTNPSYSELADNGYKPIPLLEEGGELITSKRSVLNGVPLYPTQLHVQSGGSIFLKNQLPEMDFIIPGIDKLWRENVNIEPEKIFFGKITLTHDEGEVTSRRPSTYYEEDSKIIRSFPNSDKCVIRLPMEEKDFPGNYAEFIYDKQTTELKLPTHFSGVIEAQVVLTRPESKDLKLDYTVYENKHIPEMSDNELSLYNLYLSQIKNLFSGKTSLPDKAIALYAASVAKEEANNVITKTIIIYDRHIDLTKTDSCVLISDSGVTIQTIQR